MKNLIYTTLLGSLILVGCSNETEETTLDNTNQESTENSTIDSTITPSEESNDIETFMASEDSPEVSSEKDYQEYYETGELKIEGDYDDNEARHGLWVSYYESGIKWSESYYVHGIKSGHSITFFPNGKVRYVGEYADDKQIGQWSFYDEEGNLVKEEDY